MLIIIHKHLLMLLWRLQLYLPMQQKNGVCKTGCYFWLSLLHHQLHKMRNENMSIKTHYIIHQGNLDHWYNLKRTFHKHKVVIEMIYFKQPLLSYCGQEVCFYIYLIWGSCLESKEPLKKDYSLVEAFTNALIGTLQESGL